ncbi:MAG: hypothetical protein JSR82_00710 [Verrucomicrobia bacterium]|nr:hypothetical protein [Verrucomicrobiota bacterium]
MKQAHLLEIVQRLNLAAVQYLIVGGVAVNAHGYLRHTKDLDLVIGLEPANCLAAMQALAGLGYRPRVPEPLVAFADPTIRERWATEKHMVVLQLWSDARPETPIDIFVREPFPVGVELVEALREEIAPGLRATIVSYGTLRKLKLAAGRPQDLADLAQLELIQSADKP